MTPEQAPEQASTPAAKPKILDRLLAYGAVGIVVWYVIFGLTFVGFILAIRAGWRPESGAGGAGVIGVAYIATQVTKPIRLVATLALAPLVAKGWNALKNKRAKPPSAGG